MTSVRRRTLALVLLLTAGPLVSLHASQDAREAEIKASFLYNFARFAVWPVDVVPPGAPLTFCVLGDWFVAQSLEKTIQRKTIDGHSLIVARLKDDGGLRSCQMVYAGRVDKARALELLGELDGVPVLTVSDLDTFTELGGTATFFIDDENRMRFIVNMDSARRSKVQLSAQLLRLAVTADRKD
jgi:hypothetical protein